MTEGEANRFAGALLVPRSMMMKVFPRPKWSRLDWAGLREFKLTWKVSKAALLYRARQLDLINDDQLRTGFITLKRTGEATCEREDTLIPAESPELVERSFSVLAAKKHVGPVQIAAALRIRLPLLEDLVGFALTGPAAEARRRPALSIVK